MKNTFDAIYRQHEELKARFQTAKAANDAETMNQVRAERKALDESLEAQGEAFARIYDLYESAKDRGNEYIDISECHDYRDEGSLIATLRDYGIEAFTFSSRWSSAVESAWTFVKLGCSLMGMVEINSKSKNWDDDGYEKCHAYLFKVQ